MRISDERIAEMIDTLRICADSLPCEIPCGDLHSLIERLRIAERAVFQACVALQEGDADQAPGLLDRFTSEAERDLIAEGKVRVQP